MQMSTKNGVTKAIGLSQNVCILLNVNPSYKSHFLFLFLFLSLCLSVCLCCTLIVASLLSMPHYILAGHLSKLEENMDKYPYAQAFRHLPQQASMHRYRLCECQQYILMMHLSHHPS